MAQRYYRRKRAGKALVVWFLRKSKGQFEKIRKINTKKRGNNQSYTDFSRMHGDFYLVTAQYKLLDRLKTICAKRAAEEVLFGSPTTYTLDCIKTGKRIARTIVYQVGLSNIGISFFVTEKYLIKQFYHKRESKIMNYFRVSINFINELQPSDLTWYRFENAASLILERAYMDVKAILEAYRPALWSISSILKESKEITGFELFNILETYSPLSKWAKQYFSAQNSKINKITFKTLKKIKPSLEI